MALRVLLADDHVVFREGLRAILEDAGFEITGEAANGRDAVRMAQAQHPGVAVLDLSMPQLNGLDAGRQIVETCGGRTSVVLLTMHEEEYLIVAALRAGIRGYIVKTQGTTELIQAVREVAAGGTCLGRSARGSIVSALVDGKEVKADPLSTREREVLQLVAEGRTTKGIATILEVSVKSAESYRTRLMEKLNIHDTATLVRYAIRHGLIQP